MLNGEPENSERSSDIISNDLAIRPCGSSGGEGRLTRSDHRIRPRDVSYLEWLDSVAGPTVKLASWLGGSTGTCVEVRIRVWDLQRGESKEETKLARETAKQNRRRELATE